ncbi:unnamed protein product [Owenia fusiformis]|uniref:Uncharacterized protein n=1 Tax=Owenia fusiformis TaxID=6347 RepID=A0A8J1XEJ2_OWEFU|nr:unnamed protein product [Owenia fusiformis]
MPHADLDNKCLLKIGRKIGDDIESLAIELGLSNADIENIKQQHVTGNLGFQVLNKWKQQRGEHDDNPELLASALREIGREDLAQVIDPKKKAGKSTEDKKTSHTEGSKERWKKTAFQETTDKYQLFSTTRIGIIVAVIVVVVSVAVGMRGGVRVSDVVSFGNGDGGTTREGSPVNGRINGDDPLDLVLLERIGKKIGSNVQSLAVHLGQSSNFEDIKAGDPHNAGNWGYKILKSWQQATEVPNQKKALKKIL